MEGWPRWCVGERPRWGWRWSGCRWRMRAVGLAVYAWAIPELLAGRQPLANRLIWKGRPSLPEVRPVGRDFTSIKDGLVVIDTRRGSHLLYRMALRSFQVRDSYSFRKEPRFIVVPKAQSKPKS